MILPLQQGTKTIELLLSKEQCSNKSHSFLKPDELLSACGQLILADQMPTKNLSHSPFSAGQGENIR